MPKSAFGPPRRTIMVSSHRFGFTGQRQQAVRIWGHTIAPNRQMCTFTAKSAQKEGDPVWRQLCGRVASPGNYLPDSTRLLERSRPNLWEKVIVLYACEKFVLGLWKKFRVRYFILGLWASFRVGYSKSQEVPQQAVRHRRGDMRHNNISYSHFESKELKTFSRTFELTVEYCSEVLWR